MKKTRGDAERVDELKSLRRKVKTLEKAALARKRAEDALRQSEERFRLFVESTSEWIWAIDREGRHIYSNPAVEKILGYRAKELEGKDSLLFMHEEDRKMVAARLPELIAKKSGWSNLTIRWRHKDGTFRYLESNAVPILDDKGKLVGYQGSDRDITERTRVEEALKKLLSQLQATLESTDDAILVVDTESRITNYNKRFVELWQIPKNIMATRNDNAALQYVLNQLKEPEKFLAKVRDLYSHPHEESFDVLEFKDGRIFERFSQPQKLDGKSIGRVWSFRDVTKRKHAEKALQESVEQFRNLAEKTPNMIFINQKGRIVYANEKCSEIMGYTSEELLSPDFDFRRLIALESLPTVIEKFEEHQKGMEVPPYEYVLITKQGQRLHTIHTTRLITFNGERAILGIITDITERKRAEETNTLLAQTLKSAQDCISITDLNDKILFVNHAFLRTYGYSEEDLIGRNIAMVRPTSISPLQVGDILPSTLKGEWHGEIVNRRKDGTEFPIELWTSVVTDGAGKPIAAVGVARDITERRRTEETLRESEERYRQLVDLSPDAIVVHTGGRFVYVNPAAVKLFGGNIPQDILGKPIIDFVHPDYRNKVRQRVQEINEGMNVPLLEEKFIQLDGTVIDVEVAAMPFSFENKRSVQVVIRDITQRKQVEEALRKQHSALQGILGSTNASIFSVDRDYKYTMFNSRHAAVMEAFYGATVEMGRSILDFMTVEDDRAKAKQNIDRALAGESHVDSAYSGEEARSRRYIEVSHNPVRSEDGTIIGVAVLSHDITERKKAEDNLVASEKRFRSIWDNSADGMRLTNGEGRIIEANEAYCRIVNLTRDNLLGHLFSVIYKRGGMDDDLNLYLERFASGKIEPHISTTAILWDGKSIDLDISSSFIGINGHDKLLLSIFRDITERKRTEEELKRSHEKFRELFEDAPIGYHELDAMGNISNVNLTELRMLGYTSEEMVGRPVWEFVVGGEASRKRVQDKIAGLLPPNKNAERMYFRKDGTTIPVLTDDILIRDKAGEISGIRTVFQDITEKKRAEEVLLESNAFNEQLVKTLPFGMDIVDEQGEILFMSDAMRNLVGSDAIGSRCWSAYKDDKRQCHDCPLHDGIEFTRPKQLESTGVFGGKTFQISHIGMMYQGKKAMLEVFEDVSERKKAEGALKRSEEKYRSLFEESKDVVYISTPHGKFFDINPAGVELLGYNSKEEMLQLDMGRGLFADPREREEMRKLMEDQGFVKNFEEVLLRKDGKKLTVLDTATAVRDSNGRTILFRGILRDVTKEKQLEEELTQIQKLESIGTLASGIAHDFNNILGIVLGYSSLIERIADDPEKLSQSVQSINSAVQRGAGLVKQILTFARKADVVFGPIDVNVMIKEIMKMLRETFPKTIEMSIELDRKLPFIIADATQLHQVLLNISVNARDAMPIGGKLIFTTEVTTGLSIRNAFSDVQDRDYAHIIITDTGIGMDDATRAHIFDPFFTTKEKGKGTGLGLSVVYGVMKNHSGFIDVQSEPGKGTTFNLYFPIPEESAYGEGRTVAALEEACGGTETILVVEDEEALLTMLKVILEVKGYHVITAVDGLEALTLFRKHKDEIALVMTDVGLPKIGGDQLFFELRKLSPSVHVVLMSGYLDPGMKSEIFKAGVHDFVQKPYDPNEVLMKVRESIDRK